LTRKAIELQLATYMNRPPKNAAEIVYVFVKIRKFLEHSNLRNKLWMLTFFCDWLLHTKLERNGARRILEMFDNKLERVNPAEPNRLYWKDDVLKILSLDILRNQLTDFLCQNHLPSVWAQDDFAWKEALGFYGEEVRDTPLTLTGAKLKYLEKLVITSCEPAACIAKANPQYTWWGITWEFTLSDGRTFVTPYTANVPDRPPNWKTQGT